MKRSQITAANGNFAVRALAVAGLAIGQMGGCLEGSVGDGESFTVMTVRISVASSGVEANSDSSPGGAGSDQPAISSDGTVVAFVSFASNLVEGDFNAAKDVFVRDRVRQRTERDSVRSNSLEAWGSGSFKPAISADGRFVAYLSPSGSSQAPPYSVYLTDRSTGQITLVSDNDTDTIMIVAPSSPDAKTPPEESDGPRFNGGCNGLAMTPDGRFVVYWRGAQEDDQVGGIFLRDMQGSGKAVLVIEAKRARGIDGDDPNPAITADGRFVVYQEGPPSGKSEVRAVIRMKDRLTGAAAIRVSESTSGGDPNEDSKNPVVSADGRWIAFSSRANDLVTPATTPGRSHIFVRHVLPCEGATMLVTRNAAGGEANGDSSHPSISADGRYVVYASQASDLVAGDTNEASDIFLWDRAENMTTRVSVHTEGTQANSESGRPVISGDGRFVAFTSMASNLVADDKNGVPDIFVRGPLR